MSVSAPSFGPRTLGRGGRIGFILLALLVAIIVFGTAVLALNNAQLAQRFEPNATTLATLSDISRILLKLRIETDAYLTGESVDLDNVTLQRQLLASQTNNLAAQTGDNPQFRSYREEFDALLAEYDQAMVPVHANPSPIMRAQVRAQTDEILTRAELLTKGAYDSAEQIFFRDVFESLGLQRNALGLVALAALLTIALAAGLFIAFRRSVGQDITRAYANLQFEVKEREHAETLLRAQNEYFVALNEIALGLVRRQDPNALLTDILARAGELVGTKNGYVFLLDRETQEMVMRVGVGAYQDFVGTKAKRGVGLAGQVWDTGDALAVDDYRTWGGRLADPSRNVLRAVIGVPLKSDEQVIGIIGLAHLEADKRFGPTEVDVLNRFAALAALALDNAQLFDASQRELAQRQSAEQFLESLLDNLPTMLFVKEAQDLRFVRWNKAGEEITGRTRNDFLGKNDYDFFPPDEADFFVAKDRETLASGQTLDIAEEPIQHADGTVHWLHTRKVPIMGADGKPAFLLGISEDITESKQRQEALRASEERYRAITQSANDAILVADARGIILGWNYGAEKMFQYAEVEALGQPLTLIMPERYHQSHIHGMERVIQGGESHIIDRTVELTGLRKDGAEFPLEISLTSWKVGPETFFSGILRDISLRRKQEQQLRESEERYRDLFENANDLIQSVRADGHFEYVNRMWRETLGYSEQEIADLNFLEVIHPDERQHCLTLFGRVMAGETVTDIQTAFLTKDGRKVLIEGDTSPRIVDGQVVSTRGIFRDVTERRRAEEQLQIQSAALDSAANTIVITDVNGNIQWANRAFTQASGYALEEAAGKTPRLLKSGMHDAAFYKNLWDTILRGEVWSGEIINRRKNGELYYEEMTITPIRSEDGAIYRFVAIKQDITERKRAQERETFQNALVAAQFQVSPDGILVVGPEDQILSANHRFAEMWGIPAEVIASGSVEALRQAVRQNVLDPETWLRRSGEIYMDQESLSRDVVEFRDGRVFERYSAPVKAADGSYLARVWFFHDITEIRRAESLVQRVSQDSHAIFWSARVTKLEDETAEAGGFHWETEYANLDAIRNMYPIRIEPGQTFAEAWYATWDVDDQKAMNQRSADALRQGLDGYTQEFRVYDANGNLHWMLEEARIHRQGEREFVVTGVNTEITQAKLAEQAIREREALYRSLVDVLPQSLTRKDREGRVTFGNARYFEDTLLKPEELYGKTDFDIHPRELAEKYWQDDLRVLRDGETIDTIEPHQRGDGTNIIVRVLKTPIRNVFGEIDGIQTMFWDITEEQERQEQIRRQNEYLNALQETSLALVGRLDVNALLQDIVARAGQLVGTEHGYVFIREPGAEEMELRVGVGAYEGFVGRRTKQGVGLAGEVWANNEPVVVDDYRNYGGRLQDASRDILRGVVGVPLRSGSEIVGVIGLAYLDPDKKFGAQEVQVLERFAQLAAIALDNARLYESAQVELAERTRTERLITMQAERVRSLLDVSLELSNPNLEADMLLDVICQRAMDLVDVDGAGVWIPVSPDELELRVTYNVGVAQMTGRRLKRGEGVSGRVFETGAAVRVDDYLAWPGHAVTFEDAPFHAALGVPILWQNETLGVLALTRSQPGKVFSDQDEQIAQLLATQAGAAIANTRLYKDLAQELNQRTRAEAALATELRQTELINRVMSHAVSLDVGRALSEICTDLAVYFGADQAGIALLHEDKQSLTVVADRYPVGSSSVVGYQIPVAGNPSTEIVLETRRPVAFADALHDPRLTAIHDLMQTRNIASILIAPLFVRDEIIGTVGIDSHTPREFSDDDLAVVERAALAVSTALENARLYNAVQQELAERTRAEARARQRNLELESLNRVASAMMSTDPVEVSLAKMAKELVETFHARNCGIALLNEERTDLVVVADALSEEHEQHAVGIVIPVKGNLSSEYVIENKKSLVITDPQNDPMTETIHERMRDRKTTCLAIIPLLSGEQVIGTIGLDTTDEARVFTDDEIRAAETMASQMANAIEKQRLLEATQREVVQRTRAEKIQSALFRIAEAVNTAATSEDFYATLHALIAELVYAPNMYVALYHPLEDQLEFVYFKDAKDTLNDPIRRRSPAGKRVTTWVIKQGQPLLGNVATLQAMQARGEIEIWGNASFEWLGVPLKRGAETFGMFAVQSYDAAHVYEPAELELLLVLAPEISNAITRRQEQEALVRRNRELAALNRVTQVVAEGTELAPTLEAVAREMVNLFQARNCGIALYSPDRTELVVAASATLSPDQPSTVGVRIPIANNPSTRRVLETRQSLVIENAQIDPLTEPIHAMMHELNTYGLMIVPLLSGGQVIGTVGLDLNDPQRFFTPQDVALAETIANQMANAIEKQRLFEQTSERAQELAALNEIANVISQELTLERLFENVRAQVFNVMPADAFFVTLYDPASDAVAYPYIFDDGATHAAPATALALRGNLRTVIETGVPIVVNRTPQEIADIQARLNEETGIGNVNKASASLLYVPMRRGAEVIGCLSVQSYSLNAYTERHVALMEGIASHVAIALKNAQLFQETQDAADRFATLNRIARAVTTPSGFDELARVIYQEINALLNPDAFLMAVYSPEDNMVDFRLRIDRGTEFPQTRMPIYNTLSGRVIESGAPVLIPDLPASEHPDESVIFGSTGEVRTWLGVPLRSGEHTTGVLSIQSYTPDRYGDAELRLLQTIADQIGVAVERARLFEETNQRLREVSILHDSMQTWAQQVDLPVLLEQMTVQFASALDMDTSTIEEWDAVAREMVVLHDHDPEPPPGAAEELRYSLEHYPDFETALMQGKIQVFHSSDPNLTPVLRQDMERWRWQTLMLVPMMRQNQFVGDIELGDRRRERQFSEDELRLASSLANQASVLLENVKLFQETQTALSETRTLYEISARLNAAGTVQEMVEAAAGPAIVQGASSASLMKIYTDSNGAPDELELTAVWPRTDEPPIPIGTRFPLTFLSAENNWVENPSEPSISADIQNDPNVNEAARAWLERGNIRTSAGLPLQVGGRWLGLLTFNWSEPHEFDEKDLRLYRAIMVQAATVLDNRVLFEQTQTALLQTQDALIQVQQAQDRLNLQYQTAQLLAGAETFDQIAEPLLEIVCRALRWEIGEYWVADEQTRQLTLQYRWGADSPGIREFLQDTAGLTLGYGEGFVGAAWAERQPIWTENVLTDSRFRQKAVARSAGLLSAFGFPTLGDSKTFGVAVFFSNHPQTLDERMIATMTGVGSQIAQYLQRREAEAALAASQAQLSEALRITRLGRWEYDVAQDLFTFTPEFYAMMRTNAEAQGGYTMSSREYAERFVHPEDLPLVSIEVQNSLRTTDPNYEKQLDYRVIFGDGTPGYVTARIRVVKDAEGRTIKTFGTNLDITERKRAEETVRQQNAYLTALHDTTLGLMRRLDVEELLQNIITRAGELIGTEHGYVHLVEPDTSELRMRVGIGLYQEFIGTRVKPGQGLAGTVWQTSEPIVVDDYRTWQGRLPMVDRDVLRAVVGVPLRSGNQTVGVLGLASLEDGRVFTPAEVDAIKRFAELAIVALDNAQLYQATQSVLEQTRRVAEREKAIAEVTDRLYATADIKLVLQTAAEELRRTTGSKRAVIRLNLQEGDKPNGKES